MPIPLQKRENSETGRGKMADGCLCRRLIQINAEMDAGRAQLVVDGGTFKKFSQEVDKEMPPAPPKGSTESENAGS